MTLAIILVAMILCWIIFPEWTVGKIRAAWDRTRDAWASPKKEKKAKKVKVTVDKDA